MGGIAPGGLPGAPARHTFPAMPILILLLMSLALAGCSQPRLDQMPAAELDLFGPTAMRIHPTFTRMQDWTGDGVPDGVEVLVEFQDRFGDPTKAAGTLMFELYEYRPANPEPRGARLSNPWIGSISTLQDQRARWRRTLNSYNFQLALPGINRQNNYVLTASFRSVAGGRFFNTVVLRAQEIPGADSEPAALVSP
jgi:hypothetical protein